jgi:hypothetical protein
VLPDSAGAGDVGQDPVQPRGNGGPLLETVDALHHREPGLGHHVFGNGGRGDVVARQPPQRAVVAIDQPAEGFLVTAAQRLHQHAIVRIRSRGARHTPSSLAPAMERTPAKAFFDQVMSAITVDEYFDLRNPTLR